MSVHVGNFQFFTFSFFTHILLMLFHLNITAAHHYEHSLQFQHLSLYSIICQLVCKTFMQLRRRKEPCQALSSRQD